MVLIIAVFSQPLWSRFARISPVVLILLVIAIIGIWLTLIRILTLQTFKRGELLRLFSLHEILTFSVVPLLLFPEIGMIGVAFLIGFPIVWYFLFNIVLYKHPLQPAV